MGDPGAERVARNEAMFREANEGIEGAAEEYSIEHPVPFLCECADPACTKVVLLPLNVYEEVRSEPSHFLNAVGHESASGPHARVVEYRDGWVLVEKVGQAGEIAEALDQREREQDVGRA